MARQNELHQLRSDEIGCTSNTFLMALCVCGPLDMQPPHAILKTSAGWETQSSEWADPSASKIELIRL